jgi:hypothetical protein
MIDLEQKSFADSVETMALSTTTIRITAKHVKNAENKITQLMNVQR